MSNYPLPDSSFVLPLYFSIRGKQWREYNFLWLLSLFRKPPVFCTICIAQICVFFLAYLFCFTEISAVKPWVNKDKNEPSSHKTPGIVSVFSKSILNEYNSYGGAKTILGYVDRVWWEVVVASVFYPWWCLLALKFLHHSWPIAPLLFNVLVQSFKCLVSGDDPDSSCPQPQCEECFLGTYGDDLNACIVHFSLMAHLFL